MGEFKDKISKLSDSEMDEIWRKITSYQGSYIDDFLIELNVRGIRDQFHINDYTLEDLFSKVKNTENIEFLKSIIEKRGLTSSISNIKKKKLNYTIPTAGIGILIVVIIKLLARNAGDDHKNQKEQYNQPSSEIRTPSLDTLKSSEPKELDFEEFKNISVEALFEPESELWQRLKLYKSMFEENKSEQGENKKIKDFLKDQAKEDITLMLKKFNTEMIKTRNLNQIEVDQIKQAITNRYLSELNLILMSN